MSARGGASGYRGWPVWSAYAYPLSVTGLIGGDPREPPYIKQRPYHPAIRGANGRALIVWNWFQNPKVTVNIRMYYKNTYKVFQGERGWPGNKPTQVDPLGPSLRSIRVFKTRETPRDATAYPSDAPTYVE